MTYTVAARIPERITIIQKFLIAAIAVLTCLQLNAQPAEGISFEEGTWAEVKAKAKAANKLVFVDVYTSWCGPCKMMAKNVFPQKKVGDRFNASFINYKIDAEKGEGVGIAKEYDVHGYPTYLFVNGDGVLFYRSIGSMPEEKFLAEAENAVTEFTDPRPLPVWEKDYASRKGDKSFLFDYIKKRQKLRLNSADIIDQYVSMCTQEELLQPDVLKLLTRSENANVDGPFYAFITANKDAILKAGVFSSERSLNYLLNRYISTDLPRAIEKNDEVLMEKIVAARGQLPEENTSISWEQDALRMRFYKETGNEKKLIPVLNRYSRELMAYDKEKIRKADAESLQKFEEMVAKGNFKDSKPEEIEKTRKYYATQASTDYGYRVRSVAQTALEGVNDKQVLKDALKWMQVASSYSDNFTMYEVTAGLLHKLGRKNEALEQQQKAIVAFTDMKIEADAIKDRLTGNLEKIKAGKPTWIVEKTNKIATKG